MTARYTIEGGQAGKERLDVLARVAGPRTNRLLDAVGPSGGDRCVDVGCGGGHVTRELARRAGEHGSAVGIDLDAALVELAAADGEHLANVEFHCRDATQLDRASFDLAYARYLLSHVGDPSEVVATMASALKPGGRLIVEDTDFRACFCHPQCGAFDRYVGFYRETVRRRGGNADVGPMLPSLLLGAGVEQVGAAVPEQECGLEGEGKMMSLLTLERVADAIVGEGVASAEQVTRTHRELREYCEDPTTLLAGPGVVQAWGVVAGTRS